MSKSKLLSSTVLSGLILFSVASYGYADDAVNSNHSTITNWNPGQAALPAIATGTGSATLVATGTTNTTDNGSDGLLGESVSGPITILNIKEYEDGSESYSGPALITTAGNNANGISAVSTSGTVDIRHNGEISTKGSNSAGIRSDGGSVINIDTTDGIIETLGNNAYGIVADPNASTIDIIIRSGEIVTGAEDRSTGDYAHGIRAGSSKPDNQHGDFNVNIDIIAVGDITVRGDGANGIFATSSMTGDATIKIDSVQSHITTSGESDDVNGMMLGHGIYVMGGDGPVTVTAGNISVLGSYGSGIKATNNGSGTILVKTVEDTVILTQGAGSGIYATSAGGGNIEVDVRGGVLTKGDLSHGIEADALNWIPFFPSGDVEVFQGSNSFINVSGRASFGIFAAGGNSEVGVAGSVVSEGEFGVGVFALAPQNNVITIDGSAAVIGGWQGQSSDFWNGLSPSKASGVLFVGNDSKIKNSGLISALSDRAIYDGSLLPEFSGGFSGDVSIENAGQITGYLDMASTGESHFQNLSGGIFETRHFADTDGDGERDTKAVAINDFGIGGSLFENTSTGVVRLLTVEDATGFTADTSDDTAPTSTVTTGQYLPGGSFGGYDQVFYSIEREGVEQGQFINLQKFINSGTITMQDEETGGTEAVAGDVMIITGGAGVANGILQRAETDGVFVSNGGSLHIDTVLNQGSPAFSQSDVLVVDSTELGEGGPTRIFVQRVGSGVESSSDIVNANGLVDDGEGILVVEVLGTSDAEAFMLGNPDAEMFGKQVLLEGAFAYRLSGPGDNETDPRTTGNWYLVNRLAEEEPLYSPSTPVYEALPLALLGMQNMPSLQQRVGNRHWATAAAPAAPVYVFCKDPAQNFRCLVTGEQALTYADSAGGTAIIEGSGAWVRVEGSRTKLKPVRSTTGVETDQKVGAVEMGIDKLLSENDAGDRLIGGVSLRYAQSSMDVTSAFGVGDIDTKGYGVGASLTWYQMDGLYVDAQARAMWTESDLSSNVVGSLAKNVDGFGYGLSVELGKKYALKNSWNVTPQAQLSYVNVDSDDFVGPFANVTDIEGESFALRLGVVFSKEESWEAEDGTTSRSALNMGVHVTKEFRPESSVNVSGTTLTTKREDVEGEITLGGSYNWSDDKYSVYAQVSAATGLDNFGDSTRVGGTVGMRMQWE